MFSPSDRRASPQPLSAAAPASTAQFNLLRFVCTLGPDNPNRLELRVLMFTLVLRECSSGAVPSRNLQGADVLHADSTRAASGELGNSFKNATLARSACASPKRQSASERAPKASS